MSLMGTIKLYLQEKKWRSVNSHNKTTTVNLFNIEQVKVGKGTYGALYVLTHGTDASLKIGNYCSIAPQVAFIPQSDHSLKHLTTYPFKVMNGITKYEATTKGDIIIDDDVWIGFRTIVLSGVHIGKGSVIGAGTVVTHDIPPYSIVAGCPGRIIGKRFDKDIILELIKMDFSSIRIDDTDDIDLLYKEIVTAKDASEIYEALVK